MRRASNLSVAELSQIVDSLQQHLYLDVDSHGAFAWNPRKDKEWNGADVCDELASLLTQHGLAPTETTPFIPEASPHSPRIKTPSERDL